MAHWMQFVVFHVYDMVHGTSTVYENKMKSVLKYVQYNNRLVTGTVLVLARLVTKQFLIYPHALAV